MNSVRWDPASGRLACAGGYGELTLAPELRNRVQVIAHDLVVVVLPQPGSALLVTVSPAFLRGKRAGVLGDLPEIWKELHRQATGVDLREGDVQGTFRAGNRRVVVEYASDPPPPKYRASTLIDIQPPFDPTRRIEFDPTRVRQFRLVYLEAGRCRLAAVDRAEVGDRLQLTPLLDDVRTDDASGPQ